MLNRSWKYWLSPTGAAIAAMGFFLPWFHIGCQPDKDKKPTTKIQFSGYQLATGTKPKQIQELYNNFFTRLAIQASLNRLQAKSKKKFDPFARRDLLWGSLAFVLLALFLGLLGPVKRVSTKIKLAGTGATLASIAFLVLGLMQNLPSRGGGSGRKFELPKSIFYGLSIGGWMLLVGLIAALVGFWLLKEPPPVPKLVDGD